MSDQPIRHRIYMVTVAILTVATVPFAFAGRPVRLIWGIPVWLWWSLFCTLALAGVVSWGITHLWKDDDLD